MADRPNRRLAMAAMAAMALAGGARAGALPAGVRVQDVSAPDERAKIVASLQQDLDQIGYGARIDGCALVLAYYADQGSGRDSSFGADCEVSAGERRVRLTMCDDWLVGKFALKGGEATRDGLARFIGDECSPGG